MEVPAACMAYGNYSAYSKLAEGDYEGAKVDAALTIVGGIGARSVSPLSKPSAGAASIEEVSIAAKEASVAKATSIGSPTAGRAVDAKTRARILARDQNPDGTWNCATCGQKTSNPANVHTGHITPRSRGGDLSDGNLRCEGAACNLSQGNRSAPSPGMTCAERGSCGAPYGRSD